MEKLKLLDRRGMEMVKILLYSFFHRSLVGGAHLPFLVVEPDPLKSVMHGLS